MKIMCIEARLSKERHMARSPLKVYTHTHTHTHAHMYPHTHAHARARAHADRAHTQPPTLKIMCSEAPPSTGRPMARFSLWIRIWEPRALQHLTRDYT